ncbi:MAG TPA: NUDIX domain-containing protein [Acidimicrobiales bacterium]|nr:NUDIX domain-containing protein [Acidimicrobiales bacterium]
MKETHTKLDRFRLLALRTYGALPAWARKFLIRRITPSFRVGAACIVVRGDGKVLLVRHSYRGGWGLPGGLIRRAEDPRDAALRESCEEVGVELEVDGEPTIIVDSPGRRVDVIFEARIAASSLRQEPVAHYPEIIEVRWFDPARLPRLQEEAAGALSEKCGEQRANGAENLS